MRASPYYNARKDATACAKRSAIDRFPASWRVRWSPFEPHGRGLSSGGRRVERVGVVAEKKSRKSPRNSGTGGVARAMTQRGVRGPIGDGGLIAAGKGYVLTAPQILLWPQ